jgi:hypothetical protein
VKKGDGISRAMIYAKINTQIKEVF